MAYAWSDESIPDLHLRSEKGFFSRILDRMIAARQRQANRMVRSYLETLDETTLRDLGKRPEDFRRHIL
jgi:hypothetical protein